MFKKLCLFISLIFLVGCSKEIIQQKLTVDVTPINGGSVTPPSNAYDRGSVVSLVATPAGEYIFKQWQGGVLGTNNPTSITMDADKQVTGVFEKRQYPLTLTIEGNGTVKEEVISLATQALYPSGTTVKLTASPNTNWQFKEWSGDKSGISNTLEIKVESQINLKATFIPIIPNYLKTSYELSNSSIWYSSNEIFNEDGTRYKYNPLIDEQSVQFDINLDGYEDIFYYESYDLKISPTPNPPPAMILNKSGKLVKFNYTGPNIKNPHGTKLLVGDFNGDNYPDVFSLVAVDPPNGAFATLADNNHLLFNSAQGFTKVAEFLDNGYWYSGCSGDIDKDGDLDIIAFNFHNQANGVKSRIYWNDGKGNFNTDYNGIGNIPVVYLSELVDMNNDGILDLVIVFVPNGPSRINDFRILWGTGKGFDLGNSISINVSGTLFFQNLDFTDLDNDGFKEIIASGNYENSTPGPPTYFVNVYKTDDKAKSFSDKTESLIEKNTAPRFYHIIIADLDNNGLIDVFSADKKDNIRWEWNKSKLIRK